jgi:hypothetical protein
MLNSDNRISPFKLRRKRLSCASPALLWDLHLVMLNDGTPVVPMVFLTSTTQLRATGAKSKGRVEGDLAIVGFFDQAAQCPVRVQTRTSAPFQAMSALP